MKYAALLFFAALANPAHAAKSNLPANAMVCLTQAQIDEALQATDRRDIHWLESLRGCFLTTERIEARRLECSGRTCRVRIFRPEGGTAVGYTLRSYLAD